MNVVVKCNMRELYAISRLRQDAHAQWEIRHIADLMIRQAKKVAPLTTLLLCGKDKFNEVRQEIYHA